MDLQFEGKIIIALLTHVPFCLIWCCWPTEKDLASVRLRVESTPTELDTLVKETIEQNRQLLNRIQEMETTENTTQSALTQMQQTLEAANAEKNEALQQVETLSQDVEAITQTYSNLELEYQRQQETLTQLQQEKDAKPSLESQEESFSTQVATLRAENNRLREDARSADNWMKMAVERFQTYEQEKITLQHRIAILEEKEAVSLSHAAVREQELQQNHAAAIEVLQEQMQQQVDEAQNEVERLENALDRARSEHEEERDHLQTRVEDLKNQFDLAMSAHEEERDELQTRIEDLKQQTNNNNNSNSNMDDLMQEQQQQQVLRDQLVTLQQELQEMVQQKDAQIHQHEMTIHELQRRFESETALVAAEGRSNQTTTTTTTEEDIRSRDEEIEQLRASNDAAQAWMSQAMELNNSLSEQVAALTSENDQLKVEAQERQNKLLPLEASALLTEQLERDLAEQVAQVESLTTKLEQNETQLQNEVNRHNAEVERMKADMAAMAQEYHQPTTTRAIGGGSSSSNSTENEVNAIRMELKQKTQQCEQLMTQQQSLQDQFNEEMNTRVCDLDMEVAELKAELQEAQEDKESLETKSKDLERQIQELYLQQQQEQQQTQQQVRASEGMSM